MDQRHAFFQEYQLQGLINGSRFWGKRIHELGIGPEPVHLNHFEEVCVHNVNQCLAEDSKWQINAKQLADKIAISDEDSVSLNVETLTELYNSDHVPVSEERIRAHSKGKIFVVA